MQKGQPFRFKQFSVVQNMCAMKVNTDGVLLGAWQPESENTPTNILDVGTGTGVIALMMAQKHTVAHIDAIDIDYDAYFQAQQNFELSPWPKRLTAHHTALQKFEASAPYDLIITNPPYFIDDLKTGKPQKDVAKHSTALTYRDLLQGINRLLSESGEARVVLPAFNFAAFQMEASAHRLYVTALVELIAVEGKAPYLVLVQLQRNAHRYNTTSVAIQDSLGKFTDDYKTLTKDFYLNF